MNQLKEDLQNRIDRSYDLLKIVQNDLGAESQNRREFFKDLILEVLESKNI
jgi:hypothetical protein